MELLKKRNLEPTIGSTVPGNNGTVVRSLAFEFQPAIYSADIKVSLRFSICKI